MKKILVLIGILAAFFAGCGEGEMFVEDKQSFLDKLELITNHNQKLIISQKIPKENQNNFKNIEPKKENILKELLITSDKGNIKVLFFFTTWCEPCVGILPHLENLQTQFGDKISIYGIGIDDLVGEAGNFAQIMGDFIDENQIAFPVIFGENRKRLFEVLGGIDGIPLIVLYDEKGEYIIHYLGAIPEEMMEFDLSQNLLK